MTFNHMYQRVDNKPLLPTSKWISTCGEEIVTDIWMRIVFFTVDVLARLGLIEVYLCEPCARIAWNEA